MAKRGMNLRNYQQILDDLTASIVNKAAVRAHFFRCERRRLTTMDDLMRSAHKLFKREAD